MANELGMTQSQEEVAKLMSHLALTGNVQKLREVASQENVNWRDRWGQTPLLRAAWAGDFVPNKGHAECARVLLNLGADPNVRDPDEVTAVHWTAESENLLVMKLLVDFGANINVQDKRGLSPLMLASWRGNLKAAKELLHLGCNTDLRDNDGDTAASLAEMYEYGDIVRLLADWQKNQMRRKEFAAPEVRENTVMSDEVADDKDVSKMKEEEEETDLTPRERAEASLEKHSRPERIYAVTSPQGHCVIINIEKYDTNSNFSCRKGSHVDMQAVKKLFTDLNFKVTVKEDLTGQQIHWELSEFGRIDHSMFGIFVCFLMAHGTQGAIYGRDGRYQSVPTLIELFEPNKCKGLDGKPKVFFVQACRGSDHQVVRSQSMIELESQQQVSMQTNSCIPVKDPSFVPNKCDFLICYANTEDSPAYRSPTEGSIFIQTLCKVIDEEREQEDLERMILEVNNRVSKTPIPGGSNTFYHSVVDKVSRLARLVSLSLTDAM